jgi:hypothetical protein
VFDVTGVHTVDVTYCECDSAGSGIPPHVQLLRVRWFPATWQRPNTAFTFRLLNFIHKLQSNCKVNLYDFHSSITAVFDNAGLEKPLVRVPPPVLRLSTMCAHITFSSGTTNFPLSSASMYTYVNSGEVVAPILLVGSHPFQWVPWPSNALPVLNPVEILNSQRRNSPPDPRKPTSLRLPCFHLTIYPSPLSACSTRYTCRWMQTSNSSRRSAGSMIRLLQTGSPTWYRTKRCWSTSPNVKGARFFKTR